MTPITAFLLAGFGWWLITQLAKNRDLADLCNASLSSVEKLANKANQAWEGNPEKLSEEAVFPIQIERVAIELRRNIIQQYYPEKIKPVDTNQLARLNWYATADEDQLPRDQSKSRKAMISSLTQEIMSSLLEYGPAYTLRQRHRTYLASTTILVLVLINESWSALYSWFWAG